MGGHSLAAIGERTSDSMRCTRGCCCGRLHGLAGSEVLCDCVVGPGELEPPSFIGAVVEVEEKREPTPEERDAWLKDHDIYDETPSDSARLRTY